MFGRGAWIEVKQMISTYLFYILPVSISLVADVPLWSRFYQYTTWVVSWSTFKKLALLTLLPNPPPNLTKSTQNVLVTQLNYLSAESRISPSLITYACKSLNLSNSTSCWCQYVFLSWAYILLILQPRSARCRRRAISASVVGVATVVVGMAIGDVDKGWTRDIWLENLA